MTDAFSLNDVHVPKQTRVDGGIAGSPRQLVVCPFAIICDSREQLPYSFSEIPGPKPGETLVVKTVLKGLQSGDYSVDGLEGQIAIERKSLDDLYSSTTWGRSRFEREIGRLDDLPGFAAVVIEADWREIADPAAHRPGWENQTDPRSVVGTIVSWSIRYRRVHWLACGDRRGAELRTFGLLRAFWSEQRK